MDSKELYALARRAKRNGDIAKTEELFKTLIEQYPDSRETEWAQGQLADIIAEQNGHISDHNSSYKHKYIDWKNTSITTGTLSLDQATCLISSDKITIKPRFATGTNVVVDRNSRKISKWFTLFGIRLLSTTQLKFDDIDDVYGLGEEYRIPIGRRHVRTDHPAKRFTYEILIKTKQGYSLHIAQGKHSTAPGGYRLIYDKDKDESLNAQKFENELRKVIFMP